MAEIDQLTSDLNAQTNLIQNVLIPQVQKNSADIATAITLIKAGNNDAALAALDAIVQGNNTALTTAAAQVTSDDTSLESNESPAPAKPGS